MTTDDVEGHFRSEYMLLQIDAVNEVASYVQNLVSKAQHPPGQRDKRMPRDTGEC